MNIKVLGPGCKNCHELLERTRTAVAELGVAADVEYVTDMTRIADYVMLTPGLAIDEKVVHAGKPLPQVERIKQFITEAK